MIDPIVARLIDAGRRRPDPDHRAIHLATLRAAGVAGTHVSPARRIEPLRARLAMTLAPSAKADPACCVA